MEDQQATDSTQFELRQFRRRRMTQVSAWGRLAVTCAACLSLPFILGGCMSAGVAIAFLVADSGGSSSDNSATVISDISVGESKTSPALITFRLTDTESDPIDVEIRYSRPGSEEKTPVRLVSDESRQIDTRLSQLPTRSADAGGILYRKLWDFSSLVEGREQQFQEGFVVTISGANSEASTRDVSLGNDPPVIKSVEVDPGGDSRQEVVGIALVRFEVADSAGDPVDIRVEYNDVEQFPEEGWRVARPAGAMNETPLFAFENVLASRNGTSLQFFWDVVADLGKTERNVRMRFTAGDGTINADGAHVGRGEPVPSDTFRVDNNAPPVLHLDGAALTITGDQRRGITLPFEIVDAEEDRTEIFVQWRRPAQSFDEPPLELPDEVDELTEILSDPRRRLEHQIATERPLSYEGDVGVLRETDDPRRVRLPDLAARASTLVTAGLVGRSIDILRKSGEPKILDLPSGTLEFPVAALPIGDGRTVFVLDAPGMETWRLQELNLGSGASEPVAGGPGTPSAMVYELGDNSLIISTHRGEIWEIQRLVLEGDRSTSTIFTADGSTDSGSIRGMATVGKNALLMTVGNSLLRLDYPPDAPASVCSLFSPAQGNALEAPSGIVVDPSRGHRVFVAEEDADRVVAVDLLSMERVEVMAIGEGEEAALPRPQWLALERAGARLLVVTDREETDGTAELLCVDLGIAADLDQDGLADAKVSEIASGLSDGVAGLAVGPDGLRVLTIGTEDGGLAVGGGLEQRRTITGHDLESQLVTVETDFSPRLDLGGTLARRWRILEGLDSVRGSPEGSPAFFVWDSAEVIGGDEVLLQLVAFDSDVGIPDTLRASLRVLSPLEVDPLLLRTQNDFRPTALAVADLDGDGDLDIVSANRGNALDVFLQHGSGVFSPLPDLTRELPAPPLEPTAIVAADLDGDGRHDIAVAHAGPSFLGGRVSVFFQSPASGEFDEAPLELRDASLSGATVSLVVADVDGDGLRDVAAASSGSGRVTLFFQIEPETRGEFQTETMTLPKNDAALERPSSLVVADLDGNCLLDVVVGTSNGVRLLFQVEPREFELRPTAAFDSGPAVAAVLATDLDDNSTLDLVVADENSNQLLVFLQTTDGVFLAHTAVGGSEQTGRPRSLAAADVDGDSDLDLVSANELSQNLSIFFQRNSGFFGPPGSDDVDLSLAPEQSDSPVAVAAIDVDADGDIDLVSAVDNAEQPERRGIGVFLQAGSEAFSAEPDLEIVGLESPQTIAAADLDGNGFPDIIVGGNDHMTVLLQSSPSQFDTSAPQVLGSDAFTDSPNPVAADLNGDGMLDVVSSNKGTNNLSIFLQKSDGTFGSDGGDNGAPQRPDVVLASPRAEAITVIDLNDDGRLDLISANQTDVSVFFQKASLVFGQTGPNNQCLADVILEGGGGSVAAVDLVGEGTLDIVSANPSRGVLEGFFQSDGGFGTLGSGPNRCDPRAPNLTLLGAGAALVAADLNNDGRADLASAGTEALAVYLQPVDGFPSGRSLPPDQVVPTAGSDKPGTLLAADFNGDHRLDLLVADSSRLKIFFQTIPGRFDSRGNRTLGGPGMTDGVEDVAAIDLDRDGDLDILSANTISNSLTVFFGGRKKPSR